MVKKVVNKKLKNIKSKDRNLIKTKNDVGSSLKAKNLGTKKLKKKSSGFRLVAKKLFLTYPRCCINLGAAFDQLKLKLGSFNLLSYLFVSEKHEQTEIDEIVTHLHIFLKFKKRLTL
jgi:hypothetical protein